MEPFAGLHYKYRALNQPHASDYTDGELRIANNIVGWIPGRSNTDYIIIGAHYDHLGYGSFVLYTRKYSRILNGADDNASGIAGLLELAHYLKIHQKTIFYYWLFLGKKWATRFCPLFRNQLSI